MKNQITFTETSLVNTRPIYAEEIANCVPFLVQEKLTGFSSVVILPSPGSNAVFFDYDGLIRHASVEYLCNSFWAVSGKTVEIKFTV
jgi:hypothetical protein